MIKKVLIGLAIVIVILLIAGYVTIFLPFTRIKAKGMVLTESVKAMKGAFSKNDIDAIKTQFADVNTKYADFMKEAQSVYWLSFIPYIKDFKSGVEAGDYLLKAGNQTIDSVYPYADLIGFKKGQTSFSEKSAEDRLQTAVATLDKVLVNIDSISENIHQAEVRINSIDENRYPVAFGKTPVRATISSVKEQFSGISSLFVDAKPLLKNIPNLLGKDKEKTYLILFQDDKEQRATGGFLTAYAIFKVRNGKLTPQNSENIYDLDASIPNSTRPPVPDKITQYHLKVNQFYIRDSNLSPDFVESMKLFDQLYQKSSTRVKYDGIIAIDTKILVDMLTVFGDIDAGGVHFSAKKDARCNCPQVIYTLFDQIDRPVNYVKENRKGLLGELMFELLKKALGFSPSKYWGALAQTMFQNLQEKHIVMDISDPNIQGAIEKLNFGGRVKETPSDYLMVVNVNFAGAKSNLYVTTQVNSTTKFNGSSVQREVTIEYRNPYPASDCNLERGGLCLNATLRDWLRIYVPKGSTLVNFKGSARPVLTYDELGKTVYEGFLTVDSLGTAKVTVTYTLPASITSSNYDLMIQKQSGEQMQKLQAIIDGKKKFDGEFRTDLDLTKN